MSRVLMHNRSLFLTCLVVLGVLLLVPGGSDVAMAKKPPKPTPTPTPAPEPADPEIVYMSETLSRNKKNVTYKIMLMDSDGSNKTTVLDCGTSYCADPAFSADGSKIIFVSEAFTPYQAIYIMDLDGSNRLELTELHDSSGQPEMSPVPIGGQYWIFYSDYGPFENIWAVNEAGGAPVWVTGTSEFTLRAPAFSADGLWFSAEMFPHLNPWEGHVFHFELDQTANYPLVIWEAATVYALPCYQSHPSWSPISGDYRFMANCIDTYLYDFGPLPWYYEENYCELVGGLEWCRDHIFPTNWPDDPLNLTESGADYGNAEFSPDALQYIYENNNTIYKANIDKDGPRTTLASSSRWTTVYAPDWRPKPAGFLGKLTASDAAEGDRFGLLFGTQAIYGDTAVIGAYLDDHADETDAGSAYVFTRSGDAWREQQKIIGSDTEGGDAFGGSSAVSADTVFISAIWDDHPGFVDAGSVYVYSRSEENTFVEEQILTAQDPAQNDWFGWVLAVDGDTLVVGSANWEASDETGSAHVFTYSGDTGTWNWQADLIASDGAANDVFGQAVVVAGDTIVVGAPLADHSGLVNAGAAYVFTRSGETWNERKLMADDAEAGDCFGTFVAISDDTIMVSAQWDNEDAGSVYVFTRSGDDWVEQQKITASDGGAGDWFGDSTVLSGDTAIISAIFNDNCGYQDAGSVYIFTRSDGIWSEQRKITAGDADNGDQLGWGVPVSGDIVLMGAAMDDHSGLEDAGSVYVYRLVPAPEGF